MIRNKKRHRGLESIDDRLEIIRHQHSVDPVPGAPLARELPGDSANESLSDEPAPTSAVAGSPDSIPRSEQSQETDELDSPERSFGALDVPENEDEKLSAAGPLPRNLVTQEQDSVEEDKPLPDNGPEFVDPDDDDDDDEDDDDDDDDDDDEEEGGHDGGSEEARLRPRRALPGK